MVYIIVVMRSKRIAYWKYLIALTCVLFLSACMFLSSCAEVSYMVQFSSVRKVPAVHPNDQAAVFPSVLAVPPLEPRDDKSNDVLEPDKLQQRRSMELVAKQQGRNDRSLDGAVANEVVDSKVAKPNGCDCEKAHFVIPKCETIQVAIVCAGYTSARQVVTLLKSILFYRKNPIHFHFLVDSVAQHILIALFDSWKVPGVEISHYPASSIVEDVSWIPNKHYSGIYGLLKLTLPKVLPADLEQVVVLDTDVVLVCDIAELWLELRRLGSRALGLVENQSDWYLGKIIPRPWPALARGFNTGVILMNLGRLRSGLSWDQLWRNVTEKQLGVMQATALADQDIFNAIIKHQPEIVLQLPCHWNLQLGDNSKEELCSSEISDLKVLHWNSPLKTRTRGHPHAEFFRKHYQTFLEFDGNLLRRELFHCPNTSMTVNETAVTLPPLDEEDDCYDFRRHQRIVYRTHLFYMPFLYEQSPGDVTMVVQMSMDRLQMLESLVEHWDGPASVALYVSDAEAQQFASFVQESTLLSQRRNIAYHVVYKEGTIYPVNTLRNVALRQALTPYVFLTDVDFLPMFGLYEILRQSLASQGVMNQKALIVPAFETQKYRFDFPKSKSQLVKMLDTGQLFVFRHDVWAKGHTATDYDRWRSSTVPYTVSWKEDFEPYVVVSRDIPLYDERFLGFGWNKVSHIMELDALGYDFIVLPNAFMVHLPHAPSFDIAKYRSSPEYRRCLKLLKGEFMKDLAKRYTRLRKVKLSQLKESLF